MTTEITETIIELMASILNTDQADLTVDLELTKESGIEPIDLARLVLACEQTFPISIHDEAVLRWHTLNDLIQYVASALPAKGETTHELTDEERTGWYYR